MSTTVHVLLLEDISSLGRAGDIVQVSDGYARNFLFPNGKAALATKQVRETRAAKDAASRKLAESELRKFQDIAEKLENTEIFIQAKVRNGEDIYGSILAKSILERLHAEFDLSVPLKNIKGPFPLKKLGTYDVVVQLGQGVEFTMHVTVTPHE